MLHACVIRSGCNAEGVSSFMQPEEIGLLDFLLECYPELEWKLLEYFLHRLGGEGD